MLQKKFRVRVGVRVRTRTRTECAQAVLNVAGEFALDHLLHLLAVQLLVRAEDSCELRRRLGAQQPQELALVGAPLRLASRVQRLRVMLRLLRVGHRVLLSRRLRHQSKYIHTLD